MLKIHSFLHGIKSKVKATHLDSYRPCLMISAYSMAAVILILSSDSFYHSGGNIVEAYAKSNVVSKTFVEVEETEQTAQIQTEEIFLKTQGNYNLQLLKTETQNAIPATQTATQPEEIELLAEQNTDVTEAQSEQERKTEEARTEAEEERNRKEQEEIAQQKAEEEKKEEQNLSENDRETLERIVEAEAGGEDKKGKILVANVVLNRVKSSRFPNTIKGVVFQHHGSSYQFSPCKSGGRYYTVRVSKATKTAVDKALDGVDYSNGALFFSARQKANKNSMSWFDTKLTRLFKHGGHEFFK